MNYNHLKYFITLSDIKNYSRASEVLSITQPSLSAAIRGLESELGVRLFEKVGRHNELTESGRMFYEYASRSLSILDKGLLDMRNYREGRSHIRIGHLRTLGLDYIPMKVDAFKRENESAVFSFESGTTEQLAEMLREGKVDVIFSSLPDSSEFESHEILSTDFVIIIPESHPLARYDEISLEETMQYPYIFFSKESGLRKTIDNIFNNLDLHPKCMYEILEDEVVAAFVSYGFAIALVPDTGILKSMKVKVLRIRDEIEKRRIFVSFRKGYYISPALESFLQSLNK